MIPEKVRIEYEKQRIREPKRNFILDKLRPNKGFWVLCKRYDSFSNVVLYKYEGIDNGELEIISQSKKTGTKLIISDDKHLKMLAVS